MLLARVVLGMAMFGTGLTIRAIIESVRQAMDSDWDDENPALEWSEAEIDSELDRIEEFHRQLDRQSER